MSIVNPRSLHISQIHVTYVAYRVPIIPSFKGHWPTYLLWNYLYLLDQHTRETSEWSRSKIAFNLEARAYKIKKQRTSILVNQNTCRWPGRSEAKFCSWHYLNVLATGYRRVIWGEDGMKTDENSQHDSLHRNEQPHLPRKKELVGISNWSGNIT